MEECFGCKNHFRFFNRKYNCCACKKVFCSNCITRLGRRKYDQMDSFILSGVLGYNLDYYSRWDGTLFFCPSCLKKFEQEYQKFSLSTGETVRVFTPRYEGKLPKFSDSQEYRTLFDYKKSKSKAVKEMQRVAEYLGFKYVIIKSFIKGTGSEPSDAPKSKNDYYYTTWGAEGLLVK